MSHSGYSRAVVVQRADSAKATADQALKTSGAIGAALLEDRKTHRAQLLRVAELLSRRFGPDERVIKGGFWARLWWLLRGTVPLPTADPKSREALDAQQADHLLTQTTTPIPSQVPDRSSQRPADQETASASGTAPKGRPAAGQPAAPEPHDEGTFGDGRDLAAAHCPDCHQSWPDHNLHGCKEASAS